MSRSEERQRLREEDFANIRDTNSRSRSRSRSRDRDRKHRRKRSKSNSHSPQSHDRSRSHSRSKRTRSNSRSNSRWESPSRSPVPHQQNGTTSSALQSIPTTVISTAQQIKPEIPHQPPQQSMAAIVDNVPSIPIKQQQPPPQQMEVQPPPQHIQYNIDEGTLRKFCQPYNMEELVKMICDTAHVNKEFYQILVDEMKRSSKWCKLFVHGLPWTTTQETLFNVYSQFGNIQECVILKDRNGQSKGYGFINYSNAQEAMNAINAGPQQIDGRMVGSDLAWKGRKNRSNNNNKSQQQNQSYPMQQRGGHNNPLQARIVNTGTNGMGGPLAMRRLFVYSLLYTTTDDTLASVFSQYGELEEAVIIKDKTNEMKSKGYGFVIYKNVRDAQNALKQPHKQIDGRTVHCSLAIDGQNNNNGGSQQQQQQHHAGGMGGVHGGLHGHHAGGGVLAQQAGMSGISGLIAHQQAQLAAHPTISALNAVLQAQQQQAASAALQSYDPYQSVLYQAALGGNGAAAAMGQANPTQLLQQLLAQQQQLLQSQATGEEGKKSAPAPINPNGY